MELCIVWKLRNHKAWNYLTGTRGKSRADLRSQIERERHNQPLFQFRIVEFLCH